MDFYDFFSGCGGTSEGMRAAGLRIKLGIDLDADAAKTYRSNFPEAEFLQCDIRKLKVADLKRHVDNLEGRPMLFGACAPCQPFSKQRRSPAPEDIRKDLLREFHRFVRKFRPEYVFIENVPGLQSVDEKTGPFAEFLKLLSRLGYWHSHEIVYACHYGVPQRRSLAFETRSNFVHQAALSKGRFPFPHSLIVCGRNMRHREEAVRFRAPHLRKPPFRFRSKADIW